MKKFLLIVGIVLGVAVIGAAGFVGFQVMKFNNSVAKVYKVAIPKVTLSKDPAVLERGKHLVLSLGACASSDCHGGNLAGGNVLKMGPVATVIGSNITPAGVLKDYSDGELVRLLRHGIKKNGRTVLMMPIEDFNWLPKSDIVAMVSYLRTVKPVKKKMGTTQIGLLGKVLDRLDKFPFDQARRIEHDKLPSAPKPSVTVAYGSFVATSCRGCHGKTMSGGKLPGAPSNLPIPTNLTPHKSGLKKWTFKDFTKMIATGLLPNGKKLKAFMPLNMLQNMNTIERKALWLYLKSLPPKAFGNR